MFCLITRYFLDVGIEGRIEPGCGKLGCSEFFESLAVKVVLKVLKGQSIL